MTPSRTARARRPDDIPPWAADAMTSRGEEPVPGIRVREVTAGVLAVLQRIASPYATGEAPGVSEGLAPWIGTVYAMTRPAAESWEALGRGSFEAEAAAFADGVSPAAFDALLGATARSVSRLREAARAGGDGAGDSGADPRPAATDGPCGSPPPPRSGSASGSARRGTGCRSGSSSCSAGSPRPPCRRASPRTRPTTRA